MLPINPFPLAAPDPGDGSGASNNLSPEEVKKLHDELIAKCWEALREVGFDEKDEAVSAQHTKLHESLALTSSQSLVESIQSFLAAEGGGDEQRKNGSWLYRSVDMFKNFTAALRGYETLKDNLPQKKPSQETMNSIENLLQTLQKEANVQGKSFDDLIKNATENTPTAQSLSAVPQSPSIARQSAADLSRGNVNSDNAPLIDYQDSDQGMLRDLSSNAVIGLDNILDQTDKTATLQPSYATPQSPSAMGQQTGGLSSNDDGLDVETAESAGNLNRTVQGSSADSPNNTAVYDDIEDEGIDAERANNTVGSVTATERPGNQDESAQEEDSVDEEFFDPSETREELLCRTLIYDLLDAINASHDIFKFKDDDEKGRHNDLVVALSQNKIPVELAKSFLADFGEYLDKSVQDSLSSQQFSQRLHRIRSMLDEMQQIARAQGLGVEEFVANALRLQPALSQDTIDAAQPATDTMQHPLGNSDFVSSEQSNADATSVTTPKQTLNNRTATENPGRSRNMRSLNIEREGTATDISREWGQSLGPDTSAASLGQKMHERIPMQNFTDMQTEEEESLEARTITPHIGNASEEEGTSPASLANSNPTDSQDPDQGILQNSSNNTSASSDLASGQSDDVTAPQSSYTTPQVPNATEQQMGGMSSNDAGLNVGAATSTDKPAPTAPNPSIGLQDKTAPSQAGVGRNNIGAQGVSIGTNTPNDRQATGGRDAFGAPPATSTDKPAPTAPNPSIGLQDKTAPSQAGVGRNNIGAQGVSIGTNTPNDRQATGGRDALDNTIEDTIGSLQEGINFLDDRSERQRARINDLIGAVNKQNSTINKTVRDIDNLKTGTQKNNAGINQVKAGMANLEKNLAIDITYLMDKVVDLDNKPDRNVAELQNKITALDNKIGLDIAGLQGDFEAQKNRLDILNNTVSSQGSVFNMLNRTVEGHSNLINQHSSRLSSLDDATRKLQDGFSGLNNGLNGIQNQVRSFENALSAINNNIAQTNSQNMRRDVDINSLQHNLDRVILDAKLAEQVSRLSKEGLNSKLADLQIKQQVADIEKGRTDDKLAALQEELKDLRATQARDKETGALRDEIKDLHAARARDEDFQRMQRDLQTLESQSAQSQKLLANGSELQEVLSRMKVLEGAVLGMREMTKSSDREVPAYERDDMRRDLTTVNNKISTLGDGIAKLQAGIDGIATSNKLTTPILRPDVPEAGLSAAMQVAIAEQVRNVLDVRTPPTMQQQIQDMVRAEVARANAAVIRETVASGIGEDVVARSGVASGARETVVGEGKSPASGEVVASGVTDNTKILQDMIAEMGKQMDAKHREFEARMEDALKEQRKLLQRTDRKSTDDVIAKDATSERGSGETHAAVMTGAGEAVLDDMVDNVADKKSLQKSNATEATDNNRELLDRILEQLTTGLIKSKAVYRHNESTNDVIALSLGADKGQFTPATRNDFAIFVRNDSSGRLRTDIVLNNKRCSVDPVAAAELLSSQGYATDVISIADDDMSSIAHFEPKTNNYVLHDAPLAIESMSPPNVSADKQYKIKIIVAEDGSLSIESRDAGYPDAELEKIKISGKSIAQWLHDKEQVPILKDDDALSLNQEAAETAQISPQLLKQLGIDTAESREIDGSTARRVATDQNMKSEVGPVGLVSNESIGPKEAGGSQHSTAGIDIVDRSRGDLLAGALLRAQEANLLDRKTLQQAAAKKESLIANKPTMATPSYYIRDAADGNRLKMVVNNQADALKSGSLNMSSIRQHMVEEGVNELTVEHRDGQRNTVASFDVAVADLGNAQPRLSISSSEVKSIRGDEELDGQEVAIKVGSNIVTVGSNGLVEFSNQDQLDSGVVIDEPYLVSVNDNIVGQTDGKVFESAERKAGKNVAKADIEKEIEKGMKGNEDDRQALRRIRQALALERAIKDGFEGNIVDRETLSTAKKLSEQQKAGGTDLKGYGLSNLDSATAEEKEGEIDIESGIDFDSNEPEEEQGEEFDLDGDEPVDTEKTELKAEEKGLAKINMKQAKKELGAKQVSTKQQREGGQGYNFFADSQGRKGKSKMSITKDGTRVQIRARAGKEGRAILVNEIIDGIAAKNGIRSLVFDQKPTDLGKDAFSMLIKVPETKNDRLNIEISNIIADSPRYVLFGNSVVQIGSGPGKVVAENLDTKGVLFWKGACSAEVRMPYDHNAMSLLVSGEVVASVDKEHARKAAAISESNRDLIAEVENKEIDHEVKIKGDLKKKLGLSSKSAVELYSSKEGEGHYVAVINPGGNPIMHINNEWFVDSKIAGIGSVKDVLLCDHVGDRCFRVQCGAEVDDESKPTLHISDHVGNAVFLRTKQEIIMIDQSHAAVLPKSRGNVIDRAKDAGYIDLRECDFATGMNIKFAGANHSIAINAQGKATINGTIGYVDTKQHNSDRIAGKFSDKESTQIDAEHHKTHKTLKVAKFAEALGDAGAQIKGLGNMSQDSKESRSKTENNADLKQGQKKKAGDKKGRSL